VYLWRGRLPDDLPADGHDRVQELAFELVDGLSAQTIGVGVGVGQDALGFGFGLLQESRALHLGLFVGPGDDGGSAARNRSAS
jgi:hypothetical protein